MTAVITSGLVLLMHFAWTVFLLSWLVITVMRAIRKRRDRGSGAGLRSR
jgi:hypothetical protein